MRVPLLDLAREYERVRAAVETRVRAVFDAQQFILGQAVGEFEQAFCEFTGGEHAIAMSSGTDAQLAILMAMGMQRNRIRRVFLIQGIFIGLVGTALGSILGIIVGTSVNNGHLIPIDPSIYFIDHLPVLNNPLDALVVIGASIVIATLAPLYPSTQAARLDPVNAIRYE